METVSILSLNRQYPCHLFIPAVAAFMREALQYMHDQGWGFADTFSGARSAVSKTEPPLIGVDEVSWQRHKYVTNVIDIEKKKVIGNYNSRGKYGLDKF